MRVIDQKTGRIPLTPCINAIYRELADTPTAEEYCRRHMIDSMLILTLFDKESVDVILSRILPRIRGRRVVEIGAGVGLLAIAMAQHAKSVIAIEADPAWSWAFTKHLYEYKPANLTWVFGTAESVADWLRADVVVIVTRSGHEAMNAVGQRIASEVIDIYQET